MTQKQTEQPSKIIMLAPIALVLAVYSFAFYAPQQSELRGAQSQYESLAESHHETEHQITDIRLKSGRVKKEMRDLNSQIEELEKQRTELVSRRFQMRHQLESHSLPAATMQRVTRLMETHQLRVLESQPDSSAASQVDQTLKLVRNLLKDESPAKSNSLSHHSHTHFTREVYKLTVRGRFHDLQAALESLGDQLDHVLPLSLQMEPLELNSSEARQSARIWTLTILV